MFKMQSDFESFDINYLDSILSKGFTSVVSTFDITRTSNKNLVMTPILYLRTRNIKSLSKYYTPTVSKLSK